MLLNCVAYKCSNLLNKRNQIPFHTFPFKRPKMLTPWIKAIRRDNWTPSRTSRLCEAHFLPEDYIDKPGCCRKILKLDALPISVFSLPKHFQCKPSLPRRKILKQASEDRTEPFDTSNLPSTSIEPS